MNEIENFKEGIFNLYTTRFGTMAELMIQKIYNMQNTNTNAYDKLLNDERIEIKFSRVLTEHIRPIRMNNVIEQCLASSSIHRWISYAQREESKFDCNIQQVKPSEFDWLYYGLFFQDKIIIFKISSEQIASLPQYSNKQHKGNVGEGQFHITTTNLEYHIQHHLINSISYNELYNLFKEE